MSLPDEFGKTKYPHRYRMNVGATGVDRTIRWLRQAAENLRLDMWLVKQRNDVDPDPAIRGTTDIGIGLQNETDYDALISEVDALANANFERSTRRQAFWEARLSAYKAENPHSVNPELDLIWEDHMAETQPRQIGPDNPADDLGEQAIGFVSSLEEEPERESKVDPADARNQNSELEEIFSAEIATKDPLFDRSAETSPRVARRDDLIEDWLAQGDTSSQERQPEPTRHASRLDLGEQVAINPDLERDYLEQLADARDRDRDRDRDDFDLSL